ncbi:sulfurtransferase TusA family protein [Halosolutus halophilus]|uniref:sulfurtransferase TusA family protein n=1 Tax=Halosolutus halophilus TaxID=1552990 RepID=UPI002234F07D|nr:sulfurtransferase TusA family protein [Halosolutus halophilus]
MVEKSFTIEDADAVLDVTGQVCAMPILTAADELRSAADGDLLAIKTGKPVDECEDVEDWVRRLDGASLISTRGTDDGVIAFLRRQASD